MSLEKDVKNIKESIDGIPSELNHLLDGDSRKVKEKKKLSETVKESDYEIIGADWKELDDLINQIFEAVKKFGLFVYRRPSFEGSDSYGYIISKVKLSGKEIDEIDDYPGKNESVNKDNTDKKDMPV